MGQLHCTYGYAQMHCHQREGQRMLFSSEVQTGAKKHRCLFCTKLSTRMISRLSLGSTPSSV